MSHILSGTCRLCMNSESEILLDIFNFNNAANIMIILNDFNIYIYPDDGLPTKICKNCTEILQHFNDFKQKCLEVEKKLRILTSTSKSLANNVICTANLDSSTVINYHSKTIQTQKNDLKSNKQCNILPPPILHSVKGQKLKKSCNLQCEICGRIFKMKTCLENHLVTHSGIKPFSCKFCLKTFSRYENVKIHMRSHLGIKPFICEICGKSSTKRQDLVRHMKIHSNERNYACSKCNRKFKRSSDLITHGRTHTGVRPYSCKECKKNYTSHSGLRKHLKTHNKNDVSDTR